MQSIQLACLGEAQINLLGMELGVGLEETTTFSKSPGGRPAHIAIGVKRLGIRAALLARMGNDALGHYFKDELEKEEVDISLLELDSKRNSALALIGLDQKPHGPMALFRKDTADLHLKLEKTDFQERQALYISGLVFLYEPLFETAKRAIGQAKLIIDLNFASYKNELKEFSPGVFETELRKRVEVLLPKAKLLIVGLRDLDHLMGPGPLDKSLNKLKSMTEADILLLNEKGGNCFYPKGKEPIFSEPISLPLINALGGDDSFIAGFLSEWLQNHPIEEALERAEACKALVMSREGVSSALPFLDELKAFLSERTRNSAEVLHESHLKREEHSLCLLAFDHNGYFYELLQKHHRDEKDIFHFKKLLYEAFQRIESLKSTTRLGIVVDNYFGKEILADSQRRGFFTSRTIHDSKQSTIDFIEGKHALTTLLSWPRNQLVKVLCHLGPKMDLQLERLKELQEASNATHHKLLIELYDNESQNDLKKPRKMMQLCYELGIRPTLWQLQPTYDLKEWALVDELLEQYDPIGGGILILANQKPLRELGQALNQLMENSKKIHGYSAGLSLWGDLAEEWFGRRISDAIVVNEVASRFNRLVHVFENPAWQEKAENKDDLFVKL